MEITTSYLAIALQTTRIAERHGDLEKALVGDLPDTHPGGRRASCSYDRPTRVMSHE